MIAHFVGGPLNGTDRALIEGTTELQVYELPQTPIVPSWEKQTPKIEDAIEFTEGFYRRVRVSGELSEVPGKLPAIFVWLDERPFKFVVTVDAVPGASRTLAKTILRERLTNFGDYTPAFQGGLGEAKVQ